MMLKALGATSQKFGQLWAQDFCTPALTHVTRDISSRIFQYVPFS